MAGWNFSGLTSPSSTQLNPFTNSWLGQAGNSQNDLMKMLFGGGGSPGLLAGFMGNTEEQPNFMKQFLSLAPSLQGLTRDASVTETQRATQLGQKGINDASSMLSGLGAKYSGANLLAGQEAMQRSMGDLSGKIASENFSLLNSLYGNSMGQLAGNQQSGMNNLFNLFGQNNAALASAADPMIAANPRPLDDWLKIIGGGAGAVSAISSLIPGGQGVAGASGLLSMILKLLNNTPLTGKI